MGAAPPVEISDLCHFYGRGPLRKQILFDISTQIPAGEIVIVEGPSGSGKTTLLTIIGALRSAQQGRVRVLGHELRDATPAALEQVRRQIGFIFQQHNLLDALTAVQNVELGVRVTGQFEPAERRQRAEEMLAAVGLGDRLHHHPRELSGGQRQRVAIARALAARPVMVLADEPTAALDKKAGRDVVERMQRLAKEQHTTILMVTHDNRILDVADRILHLEDGRLSTFTEAVISETRRLMHSLAELKERESLERAVAELDEEAFKQQLDAITAESWHFLESVRWAKDEAVHSMLGQALSAFSRRLRDLMEVERVSLFLVDHHTDTLWLRVSQDVEEEPGGVRIPKGTGIAGAVAESGETVLVDDAYADPRFNRSLDEKTGFRTRAVLCVPLRDHGGEVHAVAQLLNPRHGGAFVPEDEARVREFVEPLGVILEAWSQIAANS